MASPFNYIYNLFKKYKYSLLIVCIHPFFTSFSLLFPSFIIKNITDAFLIIDRQVAVCKGLKWILIYFIIISFNFIYRRIYQYIIKIKFFPLLSKDIVLGYVSSLINHSKLFFNRHPAGEIAHLLIHLNENVIDCIQLFIEKILPNLVSFIFIIVYFFYYNLYCGCAMVIWALFNIITGVYMISVIDKLSINIVINKSIISQCIINLFNTISLVRVFCKEKKEMSLLIEKTNILVEAEELIAWCYFKIYFCYYISFIVMQVSSLFVLINQYRFNIIGASDIVFWWMLSGILASIADNLLNDILQIPKYYAGITEGLSILPVNNLIALSKNKKFIFKGGKIEFKNVYFAFEDKIILEDFSLCIMPKEKVAIVGFSGSGKTTLIFLLLRMYIPDKGAIYIDDQDIADIDNELLYGLFSVILQENNILDRNILENILYSENDSHTHNTKKIYEIIELSKLNEFKEDIEKCLNNNKSIDSKVLSGGQKQRISIARSLYKEANIYLFDEPTSSLDQITEEHVFNAIKKITENNTLIVITHKLNIITWIPRILVFEKGKIIQEGSHDRLIHEDGLYKKLFHLDLIL